MNAESEQAYNHMGPFNAKHDDDKEGEGNSEGGIRRWAAVVAGGSLVAAGLSRRSLGGAALAAAGGGLAYRGLRGRTETEQRPVEVRKSMTINRPAEELYTYWRNLENLPSFMSHLSSVTIQPDGRSHWVAKAPLDKTVSWGAEIVDDRPNELISWRSLPDSTVQNEGSVCFVPAPGERGTEVHVFISYLPPGGAAGAALARLLGEAPTQQVEDDLRHFKRIIEAGEIPTTQGQPVGPGGKLPSPEDLWGTVRNMVEAVQTGRSRAAAS